MSEPLRLRGNRTPAFAGVERYRVRWGRVIGVAVVMFAVLLVMMFQSGMFLHGD